MDDDYLLEVFELHVYWLLNLDASKGFECNLLPEIFVRQQVKASYNSDDNRDDCFLRTG